MVGILVGWPGWGHRTICSKLHAKPNIQSNQARFTNERTLLAKSPGLPRRATMGCDNPPLPKRSCSFVAVSAMNEQAIDFANSVGPFLIHSSPTRRDVSQTHRCIRNETLIYETVFR